MLSATTGALAAWQAAAGVTPDKASVTLRTLVLVLVFVWAVWCIYGEIHYFRHHGIDFFDALRKTLRILFVVSIAVVLVFTS